MPKFNPFNVDADLNYVRIAHHEAGHAVATWAEGIGIQEVRIEEKSGHTGKAEEFGQVAARVGEVEAHRKFGVVQLAGRIAQRRWQPNTRGFGCTDDMKDAISSADRIAELTGRYDKDWLDVLETQAEAVINENWTRVVALAEALLKTPRIKGDDVERIIEGA